LRIGIDPGLSGAIAVLEESGFLHEVADMPIMELRKGRNQVNAAALSKILKRWAASDAMAYLEQVSAMPGQGVSSMFSFGCSYGIVQGVLAALTIPMVLVSPQSWKKRAGLQGKDKDMARTLAIRLYPAAELSRKKDIGRADAILIARYGD
jgi:crossover junction endodeoxyribonuclease RuvC